MRAVPYDRHGDADELYVGEVPDSEPAPGEALVRIRACGLNGFDPMMLGGTTGLRVPLAMTPRGDAAAEIAGFGPGADAAGRRVGDRVLIDRVIERRRMLGEKTPGAAAEYLAVPLANLLPIPDGVSLEQTAALPVAYGTALPSRGSCGTASPEGETRLVRDGREDPEYGELWVRNPGVTTGCHNLPEVNAARIRDGWLGTGDLFFRDGEGFYYFRGRTDDMFNSGGENICPKEVEDLLLSHPDVRDAAVVPVPHPLKGGVPAAVVRLAPEADVTPESLKRYTLERGPAYAHPRRIAIVEEMPLTGVGKVDRAAILGVLGHADAG